MPKPKDISHKRNLDIMEKTDLEVYKRFRDCPFCKDTDAIDVSPFFEDEQWPEITVAIECGNCGKKWDEVFGLEELSIRYR